MATATPFAIRGAFLATFLNKYAALPMTMTGTLSDEAAAKRVFETASFFTATTMPGALDRDGKGFEAAAKVRLMHSMVRFHLLRSGRWDVAHVRHPDPAGRPDARRAHRRVPDVGADCSRKGRTEFNADERAQVELSRYRCFLLGLPENLLGETPAGDRRSAHRPPRLAARGVRRRDLRSAGPGHDGGRPVRPLERRGPDARLARERLLPLRAHQELPRRRRRAGSADGRRLRARPRRSPPRSPPRRSPAARPRTGSGCASRWCPASSTPTSTPASRTCSTATATPTS